MKTINRTVVTIIPKKPCIDWANSFDDDGPKLFADNIHATSLLIPENYDEYNYELFLKRNYKGRVIWPCLLISAGCVICYLTHGFFHQNILCRITISAKGAVADT